MIGTRSSRARFSLALVLHCVVALGAAVADTAPFDAAPLDAALRHRGLEGARVGALVVDLATGRELFSRAADRPMIAASNVKILTALAALDTFGPTHRFVTEVRADRLPDANGAVGRLTVVGGGDPSLTSEQLWRLGADLSLAGLRSVGGELLLDATVFDDQHWNPAWGKTSSRAYHAPIAGLWANYGAFTVEIGPGSGKGAPASVFVDPAVPYFELANRARTTSGRAAKLTVGRTAIAGGERVSVSGSIGDRSKRRQFYRSVTDPVRYAGAVFHKQLIAHGISSPPPRSGKAAPSDVLVSRFEGKPLSAIVQLFMKYSNNGIAESLIKSIGHRAQGEPGSWANGTAAARRQLIALGLSPESFSLIDGSGLSRENRVTPRCLVDALRLGATSYDFGPEFVASLPIANRDGTLAKRASGARDSVRAKTGLLNGATALSGIARTSNGRRVLFSIIANGYQRGDADAMAALDRFAAALTDS